MRSVVSVKKKYFGNRLVSVCRHEETISAIATQEENNQFAEVIANEIR